MNKTTNEQVRQAARAYLNHKQFDGWDFGVKYNWVKDVARVAYEMEDMEEYRILSCALKILNHEHETAVAVRQVTKQLAKLGAEGKAAVLFWLTAWADSEKGRDERAGMAAGGLPSPTTAEDVLALLPEAQAAEIRENLA